MTTRGQSFVVGFRLSTDGYRLRPEDVQMEWRVIGLNFLYAGLGVVLMFVAYRLIDLLTPTVDFQVELKNGNIAVAIFIGALFLAIAIIIGGALN